MRVFPVKKLPFAALLWISSPNKKYPITVILLYETSKAVHGLLLKYRSIIDILIDLKV